MILMIMYHFELLLYELGMGFSCIQKAHVNPRNLGGANSGFLPEEPNRERIRRPEAEVGK